MIRKLTSLGATLSAGLAGLLLCGCGGGASSSVSGPSTPTSTAYATALTYSNPPAGGYSLQAEPASNGTAHLVLDLVGPAGTVAQGVSCFLTADPADVAWAPGSGSAYATAGTVFNLGPAPQAFFSKVSGSGELQVGIYQKAGTATFAGAALLSVALDLNPGAVPAGSPVPLAPTPGTQAVYLDGTGTVRPFPAAIAVGTLTATGN